MLKPITTPKEIIQMFRRYLEVKKSPETVRAYTKDLISLFMAAGIDIENSRKMTYNRFLDFLVEGYKKLKESELQSSSKVRKCSSIKSLANFLLNRRYIENINPYLDSATEDISLSPETTRPITLKEFNELISVIQLDNLVGARSRAVFSMSYYTGAKPSELVNLLYSDLTFDKSHITRSVILGRNTKSIREIDAPLILTEDCQKYEDALRRECSDKLPLKPNDYYFLSVKKYRGKNKISKRKLSYNFESFRKVALLEDTLSLLSLRYGYALSLLSNGSNKIDFRKKLGYNSKSAADKSFLRLRQYLTN